MQTTEESRRGARGLGEIARLFLKLGVVAFGGPAAHIALMDDEFVERRRWVSRQHFLDLIGATNLIPGPNSTEMTMHLGYERAGWLGLCVAGTCFILPAALLTGAFAWLYVRFGALPEVGPLLHGIKPAVIAVILGAVWKLGRKAVKGWPHAVLCVAVVSAVLLGIGEITALLTGGLIGMLWLRLEPGGAKAIVPLFLLKEPAALGAAAVAAVNTASTAAGVSLWKLGLFFLKVGAILYGSGYVLVAFLEGGLVEDYGWLTQEQLLDAIAIGQFTPGPVLTTSTFVGYVMAGVPGAVVATAGIFLPSFLFVLLLNPLIPRLRESQWASAFLDAINAAAVALMIAVTIELGWATLTSWPAWGIALAAGFCALRLKVNPAWLIAGGAAAGLALAAV